jgi:hypothetical protein
MIREFFKELFCWHEWQSFSDNLEGSACKVTFTVASKQCDKCGKSKIIFFYGIGGKS